MNKRQDWMATQQPTGDKKRGGFRKIGDVPMPKRCTSPEHDPPGMIVLEPGIYEYTCPRCGETKTVVVPPRPSL